MLTALVDEIPSLSSLCKASRDGIKGNSSGEWDIGSVPSGVSRWAGLAVVESLQVRRVVSEGVGVGQLNGSVFYMFYMMSWAVYVRFWNWMLACLSTLDKI